MKNKLNLCREISIWTEIKKDELAQILGQVNANITIVEPRRPTIFTGPKSNDVHIIEIKEPDISDDILLQQLLQAITEYQLVKTDDILPMFHEPRRAKYDHNIAGIHNYSTAQAKAHSIKHNSFKKIRTR